jgi:hypothetical protein
LDLLARVPAEDTHSRYVVRKSIRDQLNNDTVFQEVVAQKWSDSNLRALADIAVAVKTERGRFPQPAPRKTRL